MHMWKFFWHEKVVNGNGNTICLDVIGKTHTRARAEMRQSKLCLRNAMDAERMNG